VCACIYTIEIQTAAQILMKFGTEILLNAGKVPSWVATPYPHPRGQGALNRVWPASAASTIRLGENTWCFNKASLNCLSLALLVIPSILVVSICSEYKTWLEVFIKHPSLLCQPRRRKNIFLTLARTQKPKQWDKKWRYDTQYNNTFNYDT
jgi:hypothetical protein